MKRNKFSQRSLKFIERNSLSNAKTINYVTSLATKAFEFTNIQVVNFLNTTALCIIENQDKFYFVLNTEYIELQLYYNNIKIQEFQGDSCWYQGLKFLKHNILNKLQKEELL